MNINFNKSKLDIFYISSISNTNNSIRNSGFITRLRDYENDIFERIGVHHLTSGLKNGTSGLE